MGNAKKTAALVQEIRRYPLCSLCAKRNGGLPRFSGRCEICRGLMGIIGVIEDKILSSIKPYEFETFLIGAVLPTPVYEREDALRARLKIRGLESIKSQLTRELGLRVASMTRRRVDYLRPDLTISVTIDKDNSFQILTRARPLVFAGRYLKKLRGTPQKQSRCPSCQGKGCASCNNSGLSGYESIEGIVASRIINATGGKTPRFSWIGSEDRESLVLGRGRPFVVQVFDPKKRIFNRDLKANRKGVAAILSVSPHREVSDLPRFIVRTKILVRCEKQVSREDLKKLENLAGQQLNFDSGSKVVTKKIHSVRARKTADHEFFLYIEADGGIGIKQFIGGEQNTGTSISQLLGTKCECVTFDILSVMFLSEGGIVRPA